MAGLEQLELPAIKTGVLSASSITSDNIKLNSGIILNKEAYNKIYSPTSLTEEESGYTANLVIGEKPTINSTLSGTYDITNSNYVSNFFSIGNKNTGKSNQLQVIGGSGTKSIEFSNSMLIGNSLTANGVNSLVIGYNSTTNGGISIGNNITNNSGIIISSKTDYNSASNIGIILATQEVSAICTSSGSAWSISSDRRDKIDFQDINNALEFLLKLKPKTYQMNRRSSYKTSEGFDEESYQAGTKKNQRRVAGFIAQDVYETLKETYSTDNYAGIVDISSYYDGNLDGDYSIHPDQFIPFIIKAIQEQNDLIKQQAEKIELLEQEIKQLKK